MPLPAGLAAAGIGALQNPAIQQALLGAGSSVLGGLGRGANYIAQGAGNLAQQAGTGLADRLGALGNQYLPQQVNQLGGYGRQGIGYLAGGLGGLYNAVAGNDQQQNQMPGMGMGMGAMGGAMSPQQLMQQNYMQGIQQPFQFDYANQQQQLMNQYNQQLIPQLAARFGGNPNSGAFRRAATGAAGNLQTALGALGEQGRANENQFNLQRLGQMGQYLGGQQQLGLRARELGQQGTIHQRDAALRQLGLMGGAAQQQQQNYMNQLLNALNTQGNLANIGMNQPYQTVQQAGGPSGFAQLLPFLLQTGVRAGAAGLGIPL